MINLWPDSVSKEKWASPVSLLREQARFLGERTRNLVTAEVGTASVEDETFLYHFYIVAPTLNNYHYRLFSIEHSIEMYPLMFYMDEQLGKELNAENKKPSTVAGYIAAASSRQLADMGFRTNRKEYTQHADNEDEFVRIVGKILKSDRASQIIGSLLSQTHPLMSEEDVPF